MTNGINQDLTKLAMYAQGYELHPNDRNLSNASAGTGYIAYNKASEFLNKKEMTISPFKKSTYTKANWGKIGEGYKDAKKAELIKQQEIKNAFAGKKGVKGYLSGTDEALRRQNLSILEEKTAQKVKTLTPSEYDKLSKTEQAAIRKQLINDQNFTKTRDLIKESKNLTGEALKEQSLKINQEYAKAKLEILEHKTTGALKPQTRVGKAGEWVKTKSGYRAAQRKVYTKAAEGSKFWGKAVGTKAKLPGGTGAMAIVEGILEAPTVIETYKTLGAGKGTKQLGKSAVKVGASVAGYAIGAKAGAAIGTAICPGLGTVIGLGVGLLGSWLFGKAATAIVGKDELQIAKEKEAKELAKAAEEDPDVKAGLLKAATARMEAEGVDITNPKGDAKEVIKANQKAFASIQKQEELAKAEAEEDKKDSSVKIGDYKQTFANLKALHDYASQNQFLFQASA